jgi:hypothetical protein
MYTFFHGRRRKAGVVTLLVALFASGCWLRSFVVVDDLILIDDKIAICSRPHVIILLYNSPDDPAEMWFPNYVRHMGDLLVDRTTNYRFRYVGFGFIKPILPRKEAAINPDGNVDTEDDSHHSSPYVCLIPYDWIASPLVLVSAYLLLFPSRKRPASPPHA